ncbi:hypothetical protein B7486_73550, partial [cyanobacterium TDX16]
ANRGASPMKCAHLHYLALAGNTVYLDVWAAAISLASRGKYVLAGDAVRMYRDQLAAALDGGTLAELLASTRPIRVTAVIHGYVFEELDQPQHKEKSRECA